MKLIPVKSNASLNTVTFNQKTGFLRYCNHLGFKSICTLINKHFTPMKYDYDDMIPQCTFTFDDDAEKVHLMLKDAQVSNKKYISGSAYVDNQDFYNKVIAIAQFTSKHIGCSFYLDDATGFHLQIKL